MPDTDADTETVEQATARAQAAADPNGAAELARLQAQVEAATGSVARAFATTQAALRAANPTLPETVFDAADLDALIANVQAHQATAQHAREQMANGAAATVVTPAGAGTVRTPEPIPEHVRGVARIARALEREAQGT